MDKFEYCVLTLSLEKKEIEFDESHRNRVLKYAEEHKDFSPDWEKLHLFSWEEVLVAITFDLSGNEQETLRIYTAKNGYITTESFGERILTSRKPKSYTYDLWDSNYPITAITRGLTILGNDGWEVVEYKFGTQADGFAQALLKRKVQKQPVKKNV